jgi:hypothetical protein
LHLKIDSKQKRLLYYPVYIINYNYNSHSNYICLFDGLTGQIAGDRQYSTIKITLATLIALYSMIIIGVFCVGSFTDLLFAFEITSHLSFAVALPIALIVAPCVGFYASSYPKLYKKEISQVQWKQDESKAFKFTYDFVDSIQQRKFVLTIILFRFIIIIDLLYFRQQLISQTSQTSNDLSIDVKSTQVANPVEEHQTNSNLIIRKTRKQDS